jgi:hypothetical protein
MSHGLEAEFVAEHARRRRDSGVVPNICREHVDIGRANVDVCHCDTDGQGKYDQCERYEP